MSLIDLQIFKLNTETNIIIPFIQSDYNLDVVNGSANLIKRISKKILTYKGSNRKLIFRPSKDDKTKYEKTKEFDWGNYFSYIYKANDSMKELNGNDAIKRQSRKLWKKFNVLMKFYK